MVMSDGFWRRKVEREEGVVSRRGEERVPSIRDDHHKNRIFGLTIDSLARADASPLRCEKS